MITKRLTGDLPRVYRPCRISEVYGQEEAKKIIGRGFNEGKLPNGMLFHGVSGVGKTTMARIIAMGLNCGENGPTSEPCCECYWCMAVLKHYSFSFREYNSADITGVDYIRKSGLEFEHYPIDNSEYRVVVFDEAHRLSPNAQDALLKIVEDAHPTNHFILCSTQPAKIIEALQNRCMPIEFYPIADDEMFRLLTDVCEKEGLVSVNGVLEKIIEQAEGKARNALFLLQKAAASGAIERRSSVIYETVDLVRRAFAKLGG